MATGTARSSSRPSSPTSRVTAAWSPVESFGPLAPILGVRDLDDALAVANSTAYGLSSGVVTTNVLSAVKAIKTLRCGTVNINDVPGFRVECSPFGGIKDSGLGVKEGVIEAIKAFSFVKTFSLPW